LKDALTEANPGRPRRLVMESFLKDQVSQTLRLPTSDIDINKSFRAYGMDSLTALEYRNLVEAGTGLTLSATLVWNYPTIAQLTSYLAEKMDIAIDTPDDDRCMDDAIPPQNDLLSADEAALDELLNEVELLSDEETRQLLNGKS
jgi:acyl carrier protein